MSRLRQLARTAAWLTAPVGSVVGVRTSRRELVLTYDDGPEPSGTPEVLKALADTGSTATFFMLISRVRRHRELVREVVDAGHEVALHGMDHRAITVLDPTSVDRRLRQARAELEDVAGVPVRWFRPPYGKQSWKTWTATGRAGLTPVMWGPSLRDSQPVTDEERIAAVVGRAAPGAIVLCHDNFADTTDHADDGEPPTVDRGILARALITALAGNDLRCVSLDQALRSGRLAKRAWFG